MQTNTIKLIFLKLKFYISGFKQFAIYTIFLAFHKPFPKQALAFMCLKYKSLENTVGKRRNCSLRAISPFPTVFSALLKNFLTFSSNLTLSSLNSFSLEKSKICHLGKGLGALVELLCGCPMSVSPLSSCQML